MSFTLDKLFSVLYRYLPFENFSGAVTRAHFQRQGRWGAAWNRRMVMKTLRLLRWGLTLMLAFLCSANRAPAQEVTATITGTVVDQSGASITGATVTARDTARGVVLSTVTNGDGAFVI